MNKKVLIGIIIAAGVLFVGTLVMLLIAYTRADKSDNTGENNTNVTINQNTNNGDTTTTNSTSNNNGTSSDTGITALQVKKLLLIV